MDAINLVSRGPDDDSRNDLDTYVNGFGSPKDVRDCDAQRNSTLAENVGVFNSATHSSTWNCYIQYPTALLNDNISKPFSSVSELTFPCTLFPLTWHEH